MALSPETIVEQLAIHKRRELLKKWEKEGITKTYWRIVIHCGQHEFTDVSAEEAGCFPSEYLIAQLALAIEAGKGFNSGKEGD